MYIKNSIADHFEGFNLDTASIGNISTSKTRIVLPYSGLLPADPATPPARPSSSCFR